MIKAIKAIQNPFFCPEDFDRVSELMEKQADGFIKVAFRP